MTAFYRDAEDGLTPIDVEGARSETEAKSWANVGRVLFISWIQAQRDIPDGVGRRRWNLPGAQVEVWSNAGAYRVRVRLAPPEEEEEPPEGEGICTFFLESGLVYVEDDYFPIDEAIRRDPATLYEGDGVAALRALDPVLLDNLELTGRAYRSRFRTEVSPKPSLSFFGLSEADYNALTPEQQAAIAGRFVARMNQNLILRDLSQYNARTEWWLSSRISQLDPALVPSVNQDDSAPNWWWTEVEGYRLLLDDAVVAYVEPAPPGSDPEAPGRWRYLLLRMPAAATGQAIEWRPLVPSTCAQSLLDLLVSDSALSALEREILERYALSQTRLSEDIGWQSVSVTGSDLSWGSRDWCRYGWSDNWGRGADWRACIVAHEATIDDSGPGVGWVDHYDSRAWVLSLGFDFSEVDGAWELALSASAETVASGAITWPANFGHIWVPSFSPGREGQSARVNPMVFDVAGVANVPAPSGSAPIYPTWHRSGPGDAGTLDLIWSEAQSVAPLAAGTLATHPLCGFGSESATVVGHNGGQRVRFFCDRASISNGTEEIDTDTRTWAATKITDTAASQGSPYPTDMPYVICDTASAEAVDDEINAFFGALGITPSTNSRWNLESGLYTRYTTENDRSNTNAGSALIIPARSRRVAYLAGFERYKTDLRIFDARRPLSPGRASGGYSYWIADDSVRVSWPNFDLRHDRVTEGTSEVQAFESLDETVVLVGPASSTVSILSENSTAALGESLLPRWELWTDPPAFYAGGDFVAALQRAYQSHQHYMIYTSSASAVEWSGQGGYLPSGERGSFYGFLGGA